MRKKIRKTTVIFAVVLGLQGIGSILAGYGSNNQIVYGAEIFADDTQSMESAAEQGAEEGPEIYPNPTEAPEPTEIPQPTVTPYPSVTPEPTPGISMNIENLNIYTNEENQQGEELFGDGEDLTDSSLDYGEAVSGSSYSGGGASGEQKEELIRQPKLLLESFNLSGKVLSAGDQRDAELVFQNKSSKQGIYNLKVSLSTESTYIQFEKKSFYFSGVNPEGRITLNDKITITKDAKDGPVPVTFSFEYEDVKGTAVTGSESVELRVSQPVSAVLDCDDIPSAVYSTDTVTLNARVQNLSRSGIYNARVVLQGTGLFPKEDIFIGNMEAGTEAQKSMQIYVGTRTMKTVGQDEGTEESDMFGDVKGTITLIYEDAQGNTYSDVKEYQTQIKKPEIQSLKVEETKKANSWWYSVFVLVAAGMVILLISLLIRLRRQRILLEEARREAAGEKA